MNKSISIVGIALLSICSACTISPEPSVGSSITAQSQAMTDQSRDLSRAELSTPSPIELPFTQYYSIARQADTASIDQWYVDNATAYGVEQENIAKCMQNSGFQWFPSDLLKPDSEIPSGDTLPIPRLPNESNNVETYGYGRWDPNDSATPSEGSSELVAYIDSLGPDGADKFYEALFSDPGCGKSMGEAPETQTDNSWYMEPITSMQMVFFGNKGSGGGSLMSDPDIQGLNAKWGECMTNKGVMSADDWRADPDLSGPMNAFWLAVATGPDGSRIGGNGDDDHSTLVGSSAEIAIAVADFSCRQETDYVNQFATIQAQNEDQWVAAHQTMLDQMVATWEQQKSR